MKQLLTYNSIRWVTIPLLVLCSLGSEAVWAQKQSLPLPGASGESVILSSDREIYGVSEDIHYHAAYKSPGDMNNAPWSTVLYVELIDWKGAKQAASKVLIEDDGFKGKITIPKNIPSGVYYLRAYTLWMRNYSPYSYAYLPLKLLNPYSQEMLHRPSDGGDSNKLSFERRKGFLSEDIVLAGLQEYYNAGEQVELDIQMGDAPMSGSCNLSVSKTQSQSSADYIMKPDPEAYQEPGEVEFLPEINGLTLSGVLLDSETNIPVENSRLQLSSYVDPFLYAEVHSGKDGSFLFALPYLTGNPELHIAETHDSLSSHKILLSSEFCNRPLHLPFIPLSLDSAEQSLVQEILVNTQLKERYGMGEDPSLASGHSYPAFYGSGASVTYVKDYIELRNLREFIYEIIPQVSIQSGDRGSYISIQGPGCLEIYPPLVLMDNIPVPNNDELLNIPGNRIERIEVLNQAYLVGNARYSGILSIYSSKKDMSGLAQEGARNFFNLRMPDERDREFATENGQMDSSIPDIRNLLYWDPGIKFSEQGNYQVSFSTPDSPGSYVLTLRRTDPETGSSVLARALIRVQ